MNDRGAPVATALSDKNGNFTLTGIPSGTYRIYAEPLDGPVNVQNLAGFWQSAKVTSFPTQFAGGGEFRVEDGHVYRGKPIDDGKKSLALRISYRDREATLIDARVEATHAAVLAAVQARFAARLRG